ncbi:unnamed protein product [Adineta steineri]|uniref:Uncharacterized protein n=1 Tax=Adineta steineri TaxID=433720 RepID=A0A813NF88_9BILA|nr:unnamed protein product [Adineta steineri]CAF0770126.1 unnamed protein product [Adineta steineri]
MDNDFIPSIDPEEIKHFLHGLGLIPIDEYYIQLRHMLKRHEQSSKITSDQIQRKLAENGIHKDDLSKNLSLLCPRKRTSFSPVVTRKRGKAIRKRTPSTTITTTVITSTTVENNQSPTEKLIDESSTIDYDQPLDLRLRSKSSSKF